MLFVLAIATDLADGRVARWRGTESAAGHALDHAADFLFVNVGLWAATTRGLDPWVLPALVAAAFLEYALTTLWLRRAGRLRLGALGRWNGVLYFLPVGGVLLLDLGFDFLAPAVAPVAWLLAASSAASLADRLRAYWDPRD